MHVKRDKRGRQATKGQQAMEFLLTYGWALLSVAVFVSGLAYFNVIDVNMIIPENCALGEGFGCKDFLFNRYTGSAYITLENKRGEDTYLQGVKIESKSVSCEASPDQFPYSYESGSTQGLLLPAAQRRALSLKCSKLAELGEKERMSLLLTYLNPGSSSAFRHTAEGNIVALMQSKEFPSPDDCAAAQEAQLCSEMDVIFSSTGGFEGFTNVCKKNNLCLAYDGIGYSSPETATPCPGDINSKENYRILAQIGALTFLKNPSGRIGANEVKGLAHYLNLVEVSGGSMCFIEDSLYGDILGALAEKNPGELSYILIGPAAAGEELTPRSTTTTRSTTSTLEISTTSSLVMDTLTSTSSTSTLSSTSTSFTTITVVAPPETQIPSTTTTLPPEGWTAWINKYRPNSGNGDIEEYHCPTGEALSIQCKEAGTDNYCAGGTKEAPAPCEATHQLYHCFVDTDDHQWAAGICLNGENGAYPGEIVCNDYEIRVLCATRQKSDYSLAITYLGAYLPEYYGGETMRMTTVIENDGTEAVRLELIVGANFLEGEPCTGSCDINVPLGGIVLQSRQSYTYEEVIPLPPSKNGGDYRVIRTVIGKSESGQELISENRETKIKVNPGTCIDTDRGINYLVGGSAHLIDSEPVRDNCESEDILTEFYCERGEIRAEKISCKETFGENSPCITEEGDDGAKCLMKTDLPPGDCKDSDGGFDSYVRGEVHFSINGVEKVYNDYCISEKMLAEAFCRDSQRAAYKRIECSDGSYCKDGMCI